METTYTTSFRLIRLLDRDLVPSDCELKIHLQVDPTGQDNIQENVIKAMKLWIECFLDNAIVYFPGTSVDIKLIEDVTNNVVLTPDEPNDYHMCLLLHSKLNAIGRGAVTITKTELTSDIGSGFGCSHSGHTDDWLPSNEDWMGNPAFFDKPWWSREDGSTFDVPYEQGDHTENVKNSLYIDLLSMVSDHKNDTSSHQAEIITPQFKLKLITNDDQP